MLHLSCISKLDACANLAHIVSSLLRLYINIRMHLLHTKTIKLHEFIGSKVPKYAILSHRWEGSEISFKDVTKYRNLGASGWAKIRKSCEIANMRGMEWIWIDTCCIDKRSSAELSEAINSMFQWYRDAQECYAYLSDVPSGCTTESHSEHRSPFRQSEWFTRGWTLQELIAPWSIIVLDQAWEKIGTKQSLDYLISSITGIDCLNDDSSDADDSPLNHCVAVKLSWASRRVTTRQEDIAYCLMGLFNVNMPLLYGEGKRAFVRLQLEIMKQNYDASIFAWTERAGNNIGLLATSPAAFHGSADVRFNAGHALRPSFSMTNEGLRLECIKLPGLSHRNFSMPDVGKYHLVPIGCHQGKATGCLAICLYQSGPDETRCYRIYNSPLLIVDEANAISEVRSKDLCRRNVYVIQRDDFY